MEQVNNGAMPSPEDPEPSVRLRPYQEEMLEDSLERNVIVAMDTGSGKTHVAIFRILTELERGDPTKLIWFMTPSVALSDQQFNLLSEHLSGYLIKTLLGRDGVDKWSDQGLWDAFLTNVRVVVGTPAVLEQALTHGFVKITKLSLLVFDEAHRCIKGGPMNSIMANFYHPAKSKGEHVPHILGLTASPVMSAKPGDLETIEANMDATAITPKEHRLELEQFVHPPRMSCVVYNNPQSDEGSISQLSQRLDHAVDNYNFDADPYIMQLRALGDDESQRRLLKHAADPRTFCFRQLKVLRQRCTALMEQLGTTAAEWYVQKCINRYLESIQSDSLVLSDINADERRHLANILKSLGDSCSNEGSHSNITEKVRLLVDDLSQHASSSLRGIIFVEQRAAVHALAELLRREPAVSAKFAIGTFVGVSNIYTKTPIADLVAAKEQQDDLIKFRDGRLNLMIATNVLEEGIDVSACNLVICFDPPKNLVSFVQRRGRARQKDSKYVVFMKADDLKSDPSKWPCLEAKMRQAYMDEQRPQQVTGAYEGEEDSDEIYRVDSTGAVLTLANAKAHLYHFCAVSSLHASRYIDLRPAFDTTDNGGEMPYTAHVQLPSFVHPNLRTASSTMSWRSETAAIKDAAFQAYVTLHKAGLVNDNLLPLVQDFDAAEGQIHANQPSIVEVCDRVSTWRLHFTRTGYEDTQWHAGSLQISLNGQSIINILVWLPNPVPQLSPFPLYWNEYNVYMVHIQPAPDMTILSGSSEAVTGVRSFTRTVLGSIHGTRMSSNTDDFPVLFSRNEGLDLLARNEDMEGTVSAIMLLADSENPHELGLVRAQSQLGSLFIFTQISSEPNGDTESSEMQVLATRFPKRRDFLHPIPPQTGQNSAYSTSQTLPIGECTIDKLPIRYALLAAFAPSIMHRLDVALAARHLQENVLNTVDITDLSLIAQAMSAPAAAEPRDYNRLEFLGDSILKFCAVLQALAWHPTWPEGYLHPEKDRLVSNSNLGRAALNIGLDRFILTKPFTGRKWRPAYVSQLLTEGPADGRQMSSKVLADVVEALIGAAFVDGGLEKSFRCLQTFLANEDWYDQRHSIHQILEDIAPCQTADLSLLQKLIGHEFAHPTLLVEAITHVSFPYNRTGLSYERLEFLGDAVLDLIIVPKLFAHSSNLKHWELHNVHKALVNGYFLGFCCMNYAIEQCKFDIAQHRSSAYTDFTVEESSRAVHLHDFIRAGGQVTRAKLQSTEAFERYQSNVRESLESGTHYPWSDLIAMAPQKFFSDIIESVLGALYLDTYGDLSVCEAFLEKLGILSYMRRILDTELETASPKEQLGILAGQRSVIYKSNAVENVGGTRSFNCTVEVGEIDVATVKGSGSKEEAEARAASEAVKILEADSVSEKSENHLKRKLNAAMSEDGMEYDATNCDG